ncbi:Sex peptide receptor [Lepeophtheirus salmonis]|uniref:Sex peptide receptor n=2 Tax=Lepeophtheirus salmonis TaxID=72036 RepID=A0A7R8D5F3_LEPSM|nr:Sex peptide receptor [Lepeophtheirus salmonis]CAF3005815.1 Sex peptide receptor [Lepeophtheirus salmonis]
MSEENEILHSNASSTIIKDSFQDRQCFENGTVLLSIPSNSDHNLTLRNASGVHPLGSCWYEGYCYYINCSTWNGPPELTVPIYGYIMPIILAVTFLSNILIIIVLSKKQMKSPTNLVLMSMAISDLLTVIFPAPWYLYIYTMGNVETFNNKETGYAYETMLETMPQIFHTASIWLTLALALQRYIYVCHASIARVWCTLEKTKKAIAGIFFVAFLHQTTRFFDKKFEDMTIEYPVCSNNYISICKVSFADWVVQDVSLNGYFITFWWFRVLFVHLIPCVSLVILNILLFRTMKEAEKKRERLLHCKQKAASKGESKESKKLRDSNCTTLMLIVVITVFLAVELPLGIITILHTMSSTIYDFLDYGFVKSIVLIVNLCICLSYPLNFGIYCGMSRQFRETFKELFMQRLIQSISSIVSLKEELLKTMGLVQRSIKQYTLQSNQILQLSLFKIVEAVSPKASLLPKPKDDPPVSGTKYTLTNGFFFIKKKYESHEEKSIIFLRDIHGFNQRTERIYIDPPSR